MYAAACRGADNARHVPVAYPLHGPEANRVSGEIMALQHARIAVLAYGLWESRGKPYGSPEVDWYEAEKALQIEDRVVAKPSNDGDANGRTTPPSGLRPKRSRPGRNAARQISQMRQLRENPAGRE